MTLIILLVVYIILIEAPCKNSRIFNYDKTSVFFDWSAYFFDFVYFPFLMNSFIPSPCRCEASKKQIFMLHFIDNVEVRVKNSDFKRINRRFLKIENTNTQSFIILTHVPISAVLRVAALLYFSIIYFQSTKIFSKDLLWYIIIYHFYIYFTEFS